MYACFSNCMCVFIISWPRGLSFGRSNSRKLLNSVSPSRNREDPSIDVAAGTLRQVWKYRLHCQSKMMTHLQISLYYVCMYVRYNHSRTNRYKNIHTTYIHAYIHTYSKRQIYILVCIHTVHTYTHTYIHTYIHTYTHIYIHT